MGVAGAAVICAALAVWMFAGPPVAAERLAGLARAPRPWHELVILRRAWAAVDAVRAKRQSEQVWQAAVIELCDGVAAELNAGRAPEVAFASTVAVLDPRVAGPLLAEWHQSHTTGTRSDVPEAVDIDVVLDRLSARPGAGGLRMLAACWRIGADKGGAFAAVVDGLATALRDEEAQRQEVAAQLAGPRATARLLAGLPLLGLGMAGALGADPLAFLFGTVPGLACLALGTGLDVLGLWWTHRLARAAEALR
jgi:tight adherence protein B